MKRRCHRGVQTPGGFGPSVCRCGICVTCRDPGRAGKRGAYCRAGVQEDFPRGIDFPGVADDDTQWLWREALLDAGGAEFSLERRIDMVSAATVPRPARMASCYERISPMRALSAGEVNWDGVRFFVLILPSAVMAKWAWIFGLMPRVGDRLRYCARRVFRDRRRMFPFR